MSTVKIVRRAAPAQPVTRPAVEVEPMKRSNYFFPENLKTALRDLAERKGLSEATLVRQFVESGLKRHGMKV